MNTPWRTLILFFFLGAVNANGSITARQVGSSHVNIAAIVGPVIAVIVVLLAAFVCFVTNRRRRHSLEDGVESPLSSSRHWFSRFGRYRRDEHKPEPSLNEKDVSSVSEKVSSVPRYLRISAAFERDASNVPSPTGSIIRALPVAPRSAHVHDKQSSTRMFASSPLSRTDSIRSIDRTERRMVQVSPRLAAPSPLGQGERKRDLLPNLFRLGSKASPADGRHPSYWQHLSPNELARRMQEKRRAVAALEAKNRVAHSPTSSVSSCEVDEKIQSDIVELRHEVLNKLVPQAPPRSYNTAF
jgi:hypothetical protein